MPENSAENIQPTRSYHIRQNIDRIKTQILTKETAASLRFVYLLIFSVAEFTEYGYQNAFERFSSIEDLRIAYNATAEQWGGSILAYIDWRAAVPCIAYAILLFSFKRNRKYSWKSLGLVLALIACYYSAVSPYISGQFATISLPAFLRTLTTSPWKWGSGYNGPREAITFHSEQEPQNNIVLIID